MRKAHVSARSRFHDRRHRPSPVRCLRRAPRPLRLRRHLRARPSDGRRTGLSPRRAGPRARTGPDDHALPRRQLRLRLQLGRRCRPGRAAAATARSGVVLHRAQHVRHQRVRRLVPCRRASSRCSRSTSARATATRRAIWSSTATTPAAPRGRICGAATAGSSRTTSSSGAWATRWTAPGRWRPRRPTNTAASPSKPPR